MTCDIIDLFGAANIPICIGYKNVVDMPLSFTDEDTRQIIDLTGKTVKLTVLQMNGLEVVSLDASIDEAQDIATVSFTTQFWGKLKPTYDYRYRVDISDGTNVNTYMASEFSIR